MNLLIEKYNKKRIFIGLEIPETIRLFYYAKLCDLAKIYNYIKPVQPANIHMTLQFIGEICKESVKKIKNTLQENLNDIAVFTFRTENCLKGFPYSKNSKIIYVSISKGKERIRNISQKIKKTISFLKLQETNKDFIPHITLARSRIPVNLENYQSEISLETRKDIKCKKIVIFESILNKNGAEYFNLDEVYLKD